MISGVDQVVVFPAGDPGAQVAVAAVSLRPGQTSLTPTQLRVGLGELAADQRPHLITVVSDIPVSESYRPQAGALAARGIPKPGPKVWYRDPAGRYRRLTKSAAENVDWSAPTPSPSGHRPAGESPSSAEASGE